MTTLQKALVIATLATCAATAIYEAHRAATLQTRLQTVQQEQATLGDQIQRLQRERDDARTQMESLRVQNENLETNHSTTELLRLRGQVASLRGQARELERPNSLNNDPTESAAKDLVGKITLMKQRLEQMPDKNIPELQYLDSAAWARVAQAAKLDTDADVREALSNLRNLAKQSFAPQLAQALQAYAQANAGQLPTDPSQLKPYFEVPVDDATLARYRMIGTGDVHDLQPGQKVIAEKAPVDDEHDYLFKIGLNGRESVGVGQNGNVAEAITWSPGATPRASYGK